VPWSIEQYQEMVVKEFGYNTSEQVSYALQMLRSARRLYPNDMEIKDAAFYLKFNRARRGDLGCGDVYKDVPLYTCSQQETKFSNIVSGNKPTLVMSGSVT